MNVRASFVFAVQTWLAQTPDQAKKAGTPGYVAAGMARRFWILVQTSVFCLADLFSVGGRNGAPAM